MATASREVALDIAPKTAKESKPAHAWLAFVFSSLYMLWRASCDVNSLISGVDSYRDLGSFWVSGLAAAHGLNPYAIYPETWRLHPFFPHRGPLVYDINLNPPSVLPLFQMLSHLSLKNAAIVWTWLSACVFIAGTAFLLIKLRGRIQVRAVIWLLLSQAVMDTLWVGQNYALMFALVCILWVLITTKRVTAAAICIGVLVAMRPNLVLWMVMLYFAGYKRQAIVSAVTAASLSALPILLYGPSIYSLWLHAVASLDETIFPTNISIIAIATRLGYAFAGKALAALVAVGLLLFVRRRKPSEIDLAGIAICAGILCSPIGWFENLVFVAPLLVISKRFGPAETFAVALCLIPDVTAIFTGTTRLEGLIGALPYFMALYLILASFLKGSYRPTIRTSI